MACASARVLLPAAGAALPAGGHERRSPRRGRDVGRRRALEEMQRQQARELAEAVERQKGLLREIHHRVKNHLQFIVSLMRMEARKSGRRRCILSPTGWSAGLWPWDEPTTACTM